MNVPTRTKVNLGFGLALVFLVITGIYSSRESAGSIRAGRQETAKGVELGSVFGLVTVLVSLLLCNIDASKRQPAESKNQLLAAIVDSSDDAIIGKTLDGIVTSWNKGAEEMYGYGESEIIGKPISILVPPDHQDEMTHLLAKVSGGECVRHFHTVRMAKDGNRVDVSLTISPIKGADGKITGVSTIARNITARKRAEAELIQERHQLHTLVDNFPEAIYFKDCRSRFTRINLATAKALGLDDPGQAIGKTDFDFFADEHARQASIDEQEIIRTGLPQVGKEERETWPDGRVTWASTTKMPLRDASGNIIGTFGVSRDITNRKRAEEELRLTQFSVEHASDAVFWMNPEGRIVYVNEAACRSLACSQDELLSLSIPDIDPNFAPGTWTAAWEKLKALGSITLETCHRTKAGKDFPVEITSNYLEFGEKEYAFTFARDITERKQAEESLRSSRNMLASVLNSVPQSIFWKDRNGVFLGCNEVFARAEGFESPEQIIGKTDFDLPSHQEAEAYLADDRKVIESNRAKRHIVETLHQADGSRLWIDTSKVPLTDGTGRVYGVLGIYEDITERKRAEEALRESEDRYRDLAENAAELIQSVSPEGRFLYVNRAWRETLGYAEEETLQLNMMDIVATEHLPQCKEVLSNVMTGATFNDVETVFVAKNGNKIFVRGSVNCRVVDGKPVAARGIFRDVTAHREVEKMKDEFVSTVSHELRTPLTSIRGAIGLLAGGVLNADPAKAKRMLDIAVSNTDRLIRLINDILDIERMESGRIKMEKHTCEVATLIEQAVNSVREVADKGRVTIEVPPAGGRLLADGDRIVQTLTNLLGNAIKFSPPGGTVSLSVSRLENDLLFEVKDQGRGIPADKLTLIFERFQQADASDRREKGGTGLGLAISRSIVEQHSGRIWVESVLGVGSSFFFTLPAMAEPAEQMVPGTPSANCTVLVCDDDPSICSVVRELLEQHGYGVVVASSGKEAVQLAVLHQPAGIILDLLMPEMDGWQTLAALRDRPQTREIPVIILSVLAPRELRNEDIEVAGWLRKPIDEALLFHTLSIAVSGANRSARVLVVEDDLDLVRVIREVFERHGSEVLHAQTGREAIQVAERALPDLVVLDLALPEGDGFDVVAGLRLNDILRRVPLVVYTAMDLDERQRDKLKLGKTVFLTKGRISHEEFERRVVGLVDGIIRPVSKEGSDGRETHPHY